MITGAKRSICVYCGARNGVRPAFTAAAHAVGAMIAANRWRLVFGAGDVGIMGAVAHSAAAGGAETLGVIPAHLVGREATAGPKAGPKAGTIVTETMHERKKVMFANSHAAVVLPGGAGTLDEFFEVLTWAQIGLHAKPVIVLDQGGYWQPLLALIEHIIAQGFAAPNLRSLMHVASDVAALEAVLDAQLHRSENPAINSMG